MNVTVFGLGKLGAPMASLFAAAGHSVFCVDSNPEALRLLSQRRAPVQEPGLQTLVSLYGDRLRPTAPHWATEAVRQSNFVFLMVPTPSLPDGSFSNEYLLECLKPIGEAIRQESRVHVVVTSTTSPGECDATLIPALDAITGRKAGIDHGFSYNPEFIALGSVVQNMRKPDFVLIGSATPRHAEELLDFYQGFYGGLGEKCPPLATMNLLNAELAKLAVNCYTTMKISYANQLGTLCEVLPGADAHVVCRAIGMDSRIGPKYLQPATTFSGPCFPRDGRAMLEAVRRAGCEAPLCHATTAVNDQQWRKIERLILDAKPQNLAFLGLSYKPDTAVTEESMSERIIGRFANEVTYPIRVHDPLATTAHRVTQCLSARDAVRGADVVLIATAHPEYRALERHWFLRSALIIDCWDLLDGNDQFRDARRWVPGKGATWIS